MSVVLLIATFALLGVAALASRRAGPARSAADLLGGSHPVARPGHVTMVALRSAAAIVGIWLVAPLLIVIPSGFTGRQSFQFPPPTWSTRWYEAFFNDPRWLDALLGSLKIALIVTVSATFLGTAAALGLARTKVFAKVPLNAILLTPMMVPTVILAIGVYAVFLEWHLVGSITGFVLVHTCLALPFVVVTVGVSLQNFDTRLEDAAASLGAHPLRAFFLVTLRLIAPGIVVGALFAFIASFDELVVALFLTDPTLRTLPVQMFSSVVTEPDPTVAVASTLIFASTLLVLSAVMVAATRRQARG